MMKNLNCIVWTFTTTRLNTDVHQRASLLFITQKPLQDVITWPTTWPSSFMPAQNYADQTDERWHRWIDEHTHTSLAFFCTNKHTHDCLHIQPTCISPRAARRTVRGFFFFFPGRLCHRTANQRTAWEMSLCPRSCSCQGWGFIAVHFVALSKIGGTGTWPCEEKNLCLFFPPQNQLLEHLLNSEPLTV